MKKITIAIDGHSSTGKSTVAKALAKRLSYTYVDSGAMYRAVTYFAMKNKCFNDGVFNVDRLLSKLNEIQITFLYNANLGFAEVYLNGTNIESEIRLLPVSNNVSHVAAVPQVRKLMVKQQQAMGKHKGVVMDGRDIGTVVFKDADLKLFMTASSEVRARRRFEELISKGEKVEYDEVLENITIRDRIDSTREDSPLIKANDAIEIDNSELSKSEQLAVIISHVDAIVLK